METMERMPLSPAGEFPSGRTSISTYFVPVSAVRSAELFVYSPGTSRSSLDNAILTLPQRSLSPSLQSASSFGDYSDSEKAGPTHKFFKATGPRVRENRDLLQCPTVGCDGMGHVSGNYATHRRSVFLFSCQTRL